MQFHNASSSVHENITGKCVEYYLLVTCYIADLVTHNSLSILYEVVSVCHATKQLFIKETCIP